MVKATARKVGGVDLEVALGHANARSWHVSPSVTGCAVTKLVRAPPTPEYRSARSRASLRRGGSHAALRSMF